MLKIGIPRGLIYYDYHPLWKTFLEELGAEVVVSPPTTRAILGQGVKAAESEFCLPVKLYYGHVLSLRGMVDKLFIPRVVSVEKRAYTCPKLLGLPDMIRAVDDAPPIWSPVIDFTKGKRQFYSSVYEVGKTLTNDSLSIFRAYLKAVNEYKRFQARLKAGIPRHQAIESQLSQRSDGKSEGPLRIGLVGHDYIISDSYVTMNLSQRLEKLGASLLTADTVPRRIINREASTLPKSLFWTYEKDIIGAAFHWLKKGLADGIIYVLAFACGPDSLIQTLLEYEAKKMGKMPLMSIVIDEHSGEAGLITRIEAFVEMLMRAKKRSLVEA